MAFFATETAIEGLKKQRPGLSPTRPENPGNAGRSKEATQ